MIIMKQDNIEITISSDLDYDCLIAEIMINDVFVGLVTNEPDKGICFEVPEGQMRIGSISLETFQAALVRAKDALIKD